VNFFEAQDSARRKTWQLVALFAAAVLSLVVLTNLLVAAVVFYSNTTAYAGPVSLADRLRAMPPGTWFLISTGVVGMIGVASLYKYLALRGGGRAIAEMLGGRLLTRDTATPGGRRLLNVVEEMAIASGMPVPPVYVVPEHSINAFAAGLGPDDAVVGVNEGTIEHLNRDELQGVIAHEFSHIVNGDSRINLRLIAALHGIVFLSMVGWTILRGFRYSGRRRDSRGNAPVLVLGVGLLVIGYAGTFFGNLIKAAVSRQREYLADAAAVQFTRNPGGIADALKKIGGLADGSKMRAAAATEASHMFFGQVQRLFLNSIMATHPPLPKRIRAIEPGWDGRYIEVSATPAAALPEEAVGLAGDVGAATPRVTTSASALDQEVGTLSGSGLAMAHELIGSVGTSLREAAHDPFGSRALIYAFLLDDEPDLRRLQLAHLEREAERGVPALTAELAAPAAALNPTQRLTLIEMSMPALKALSAPQYQRFVGNCVTLIKLDRKITLLEWVLHRIMLKELTPHFEGPSRVRVRHRSIDAVGEPAGVLVSALAQAGHADDPQGAARAFAAGRAALDSDIEHRSGDDPNYQALNAALKELRALRPLLKPRVLKACAAAVLEDESVTFEEGALLQGVAAALDCPLPPSIYASRSANRHG